MRFLIVENINQSRDTLKVFAHKLGAMKVDTCQHTQEIISLCENFEFDVILLGYDLGEDKKNGQQLLEELRSKKLIQRQCIIVMITAEVSQAMVLAALEHKPDEYLAKPYSLNDLSIRLKRCLHKKKAMLDIYNALDSNNYQLVLSLCEKVINLNSVHKTECLGIKSRLYFESKQFAKASEIYETYLGATNCQWAAIGLGKIALFQNDYELAINYFNDIVENHPLYLSAYDWLAKTYELNHQSHYAEEILEKALLVSPLSVPRLKKYADLCLLNENYDKATHAFSKTTDLAYHSVHKKPENTLDFVEALLEYAEDLDSIEIRKLSYKAFKSLTVMLKDFSNPEIKIHSQLLVSRLHHKIKDPELSKKALKEAESLLFEFQHQITHAGTLSIAKSLIALGKGKQADQLLNELAQSTPGNTQIQSKISSLSEKTQLESDKKAAQNALEIGVNLYKSHHYSLAIEKLNKALIHFPNHMGIKLNLLQVLLVSFDKSRDRLDDLSQAEELIQEFRVLTSDSEFYIRFTKLNHKYIKIYKSLK
jgi:DNA-binding response OmpR family regulator/lipopolysaccharide biosynthesis regulator YciM